jgi:hypothetical protein
MRMELSGKKMSWLSTTNPRDRRRKPRGVGRAKEENGHIPLNISVSAIVHKYLEEGKKDFRNRSDYLENLILFDCAMSGTARAPFHIVGLSGGNLVFSYLGEKSAYRKMKEWQAKAFFGRFLDSVF